ncbi:MAG: alkyl sulfatase dimerization domain-containing protein [Candidatus Binatia bacterium]|nr:alkyl sulfatase dimerization domain-containing protein [Candidatus Binatia bacterium]
MSAPIYRARPNAFDIKPASQTETQKVNDFIHLSEGLSNSYMISTSEGRIVINTGMGFEAPVHKDVYDKADSSATRYILLTQGHVDHVGGVDHFREDGTDVVAQANNPEHQEYDARIQTFRTMRSFFAFAEAITAAGRMPGAKKPAKQSIPTPTILFDDHHRLELGGLEIELFATPGGETRDSLIAWLPQHRICFVGNLFSALFGHIPNLVTIRGDRYRDPMEFVESIERVRDLEPEVLLVGHGGPIHGAERIREEIERVRGAVLYLQAEVVKGMNAQKTVHQLMREIELPPELEVGQGYGKVSWDVRAIWELYAGWFHASSTTELYPEPVSTVYEDLVELAGGAERVASGAAAKVAAGDPVAAIHLAEIALAADDANATALRASRDAHCQLEEKSVNFWETKWLRQQITQTEKKLG